MQFPRCPLIVSRGHFILLQVAAEKVAHMYVTVMNIVTYLKEYRYWTIFYMNFGLLKIPIWEESQSLVWFRTLNEWIHGVFLGTEVRSDREGQATHATFVGGGWLSWGDDWVEGCLGFTTMLIPRQSLITTIVQMKMIYIRINQHVAGICLSLSHSVIITSWLNYYSMMLVPLYIYALIDLRNYFSVTVKLVNCCVSRWIYF